MSEIQEPLEPRGAKRVARLVFRHENAILGIVLAAVLAAMGIGTKGLAVSPANLRNILIQSSVRGVSSVGQAMVILTSGIDISVGGVSLLAGILGVAMMTATPAANILGASISPAQAIPIMLLVGLGIGAANGASVSRLSMPALIVTLSIWQMANGAAYAICKGYTIAEQPRSLAFVGQGYIAGVPVPIIVTVVVFALAYFVLYHTRFGRSVYAVGGNPMSAWLAGIDVKRILFSVYAISGFLAALAGLIVISRTMSASMVLTSGLELDTIASVAVGGVSLGVCPSNSIGQAQRV